MAYTTVARRDRAEETIRGSRFRAVVARIGGPADALALQRELRARHPDASHVCLAWRSGAEMGADDDVEPGGTAGRPMLEVLLKRELDHVAGACVRWFGGTKLGAGGLARAYGGTVAKALDAAGALVVHATSRCLVSAPYARVDTVHRLLSDWPGVRKGEPRYHADGLRLPVVVRADQAERLARALADATAGDARLARETGEPVAPGSSSEPGTDPEPAA